MANIIWTPPDGWVEESGAHVSFKAPCDCSAAGNLVIGSNSYSIVDAIGGTLTGSSGVFVSGAVLDFILDCENLKAYLQNPALAGFKQGTWTPTAGGGGSFSSSNGVWYKIGRLVYVKGYCYVGSAFSVSQPAYITGLPFTAADDAGLNVLYSNLVLYTTSGKSSTMSGWASISVNAGYRSAYLRGCFGGRVWGQNWDTLGTGGFTFSGCYLTNE